MSFSFHIQVSDYTWLSDMVDRRVCSGEHSSTITVSKAVINPTNTKTLNISDHMLGSYPLLKAWPLLCSESSEHIVSLETVHS